MKSSTQIKAFRCFVVAAVLLVGFSGSPCMADFIGMLPGETLTATLTVDAGTIIAGGNWGSGTEFISTVFRPVDETAPLEYSYTFTASGSPSLSHLILQVSDAVEGGLPAFDPDNPMDYLGPTVEGAATYGPGVSNPGFPTGQSVWGIKFQDGLSSTIELEFESYRFPMLGDFYAKGGNTSYAYNSGFGSLDGANIYVPNSSYVPVPGALLLGMLGIGVMGLKLRKFA